MDSARIVGQSEYIGSISEGKYADLVLIDGDPLTYTSDLRKASLVLKGNKLYQPDAIYRSLGVKPFVKSAEL